MDRIKNFQELIQDYVGSNKTVIDTKTVNLTAPGENYMSEIIKVDVILQNKDTATTEELHLVAKLVTDNDFLGPTSLLTKNEFLFYKRMVPSIKRFHEKYGLPFPSYLPEFVGGRINLTGSDEPDKDAVIVLENLIEKGYQNLDRHIGFDLEGAKLVLDDMATFHAVPLAMKLKAPEEFDTEIKANQAKVKVQGVSQPSPPNDTNDSFLSSEPSNQIPLMPPTFFLLKDFFEQNDQYAEVAEKYIKHLKFMKESLKGNPEEFFIQKIVEPFATLLHTDMWINNTMQIVEDGVPVKNKIVDYQMCVMGSPTVDLLFFLFSSVQLSCLEKHLDSLLKHYHETFSNILKACDCYSPQFSYEQFLEEIRRCGDRAIGRSLFMLPTVIFAKKGEAVKITDTQTMTLDDIPSQAKEKLIFMCVEATKRNWF